MPLHSPAPGSETTFLDPGIIDEIRGDFPILKRMIGDKPLIYMDNAATSLKPNQVIDAVLDSYRHSTANIHRGKHLLSEEASDRYEEARYKIALAMGCGANEVVFVRNTTEALNAIPRLLKLAPGDLVIGFLDAHHSHALPWQRCSRFEIVASGVGGEPDLDRFASLLKLGPKAVVVTHCSNVSGAYFPLEHIAGMAREAGAHVIVDAAQSAPHQRIDFRGLDVDFLAFSGHKMLAPSGIGCLIGRAELLNEEEPVNIGGGTVDEVREDGWTLRRSPHRHEAGTPAIEAAIGLGAAIDYLENVGFSTIAAHEQRLAEALLGEVLARDYLHLLGPREAAERAPLVSFAVRGCPDLRDLVRALSDAHGIMCRSGHLCCQPFVDTHTDGEVLRVSAYIYNTTDEVARVFEALDGLVPAFVR